MPQLNRNLSIAIALFGFVAMAMPAQARVVNVDFNGANQGDLSTGPTYVGSSAPGIGTVWNGVAVDSRTGVTIGTPGGTGNDYSIPVNASGFQDENGGSTGVGVAFTNAGGDDNPSGGNALWRDYLGANFDGDNANVPFTISGLGSATTANLYFYHFFDNGAPGPLSLSIGGTPVAFATNGIFNSSNTLYYQNVPVVAGSISGAVLFVGGYSILNGMSIEFVPEPSSLTLCGLGAFALIAVRRRRAA